MTLVLVAVEKSTNNVVEDDLYFKILQLLIDNNYKI